MRFFFFTGIFVSSQILACDIPMGFYSIYSESEYTIDLDLYENGGYRYREESHLAGTHIGSEHIWRGLYECEGTVIWLYYLSAEKPLKGEYYLGSMEWLSPDYEIGILDFTKDSTAESSLGRYTYYKILKDE